MSQDDQQRWKIIDLTADDDQDTKNSIQIEDEEDDEDLKLAIKLSLQSQTSMRDGEHADAQVSPTDIATPGEPVETAHWQAPSTLSFMSLDRKQMEAERLARLKRKRDENNEPQGFELPSRSHRIPSPISQKSTTVKASTMPELKKLPIKDKNTFFSNVQKQAKTSSSQWLSKGTFFLTAQKSSRQNPDSYISMPELLVPIEDSAPLKSALLCTFMADFDWLLPHFNTKKVSFVFVLHTANDLHRKALRQDFDGIGNVKLVFPDVKGPVDCMHSKLMLLFYENTSTSQIESNARNRCRIVVPTANLVPYDWGVGGFMENTAFVIDLPEKHFHQSKSVNTARNQASGQTQFQTDLVGQLKAMGIPEAVLTKLDRYDFSATSNIGLVHSIRGSHIQPLRQTGSVLSNPNANLNDSATACSANRTGLLSLSHVIKSLGLEQPIKAAKYTRLDYLTSSLGGLKQKLLSCLSVAGLGQPCLPNLIEEAQKVDIPTKSDSSHTKQHQSTHGNLRVYFPSDQTVRKSKGGPNSAHTICFDSKHWDSTTSTFPKQSLRDCVGVRNDGILMHSKILFATFSQPQTASHSVNSSQSSGQIDTSGLAGDKQDNKLYVGWVYVGSANLSENAWGTISTDPKTKKDKINCRNWETGIVLPVPVSDDVQCELDRGQKLHELTLQQLFGHVVPVPMKEPADTYEDGRRPWFFRG